MQRAQARALHALNDNFCLDLPQDMRQFGRYDVVPVSGRRAPLRTAEVEDADEFAEVCPCAKATVVS